MSRLPALLLAPVILTQARRLERTITRVPPAKGPGDGLVSARGSTAAGHPLRLLVLGDSTAMGEGAATIEDALPGRLARLLASEPGARSVAWRAVGRGGATSTQVLHDFADAAVAVHFDLAVVLVGWNDALKLRPGGEFARSLGALLDRLRAGSPEATVVVVGPPAFGRFAVLPDPLRWALDQHARGIARVGRRVSRDHGALVAPGFDGQSVAGDGFHPDPSGYQHLAEGVVAALSAS